MAINEKYSFKDFTGQTFLGVDPDEFSNSEIVGSCFAQEVLYSNDAAHNGSSNHRDTNQDVFPVGVHNITFTRCNLDNCKVGGPPTAINGGIHRKIRVMNDNEDWILGIDHKPVEPIRKREFEQHSLSVDPADIRLARLLNSDGRPLSVIQQAEGQV